MIFFMEHNFKVGEELVLAGRTGVGRCRLEFVDLTGDLLSDSRIDFGVRQHRTGHTDHTVRVVSPDKPPDIRG